MAKFENLFASDKKEPKEKKEKHPNVQLKRIHYSKLVRSAYQFYNESDETVLAIADLIETDGAVLQSLLVRSCDADEYEIIAGHKRTLACKLLVEERQLEKYALLPCFVLGCNDIQARYRLMSTNVRQPKTEYEIMKEIDDMKYLLTHHAKDLDLKDEDLRGRMIERIGHQLNMKYSKVNDYSNISKNLGDKGKAAFKEGELNKTGALVLASLPEAEQEKALDKGITKPKEIKAYKAAIEKSKEPEVVPEEPKDTGNSTDSEKKSKPEVPKDLPAEDKTMSEYNKLVGEKILLTGDEAEKIFIKRLFELQGWEERINDVKQRIQELHCNNCNAITETVEKWLPVEGIISAQSIPGRGIVIADLETYVIIPLYPFMYNFKAIYMTKKESKPVDSAIEPDKAVETLNTTVKKNTTQFAQLKNMEEREQFIRGYKSWQVWTKNEFTEETFYRYDLPDQSAIVIRYFPYYVEWSKSHEEGVQYYLLIPGYKHFKDCETNMTLLKEHLKKLRKGD